MNRKACFVLFLFLFSALTANADPVGHVSLGNLQAGLDSYNAQVQGEADARAAATARNRGAIDQGVSLLNRGLGSMDTLRDFGESQFGPLVPEDIEFDPNFDPPGAPSIPVHCEVSGGDACRQCYDSAYRKLNFVRHYLEVLRGIYGATRNYTNSAIAFGDSMSGLHGGFGIAWPPERKGIQDAFKKMGTTYDEKYEAYMRELQEGLQAVASCEKQFFDEDDWYSRYGFIYFTYMQDRYRR